VDDGRAGDAGVLQKQEELPVSKQSSWDQGRFFSLVGQVFASLTVQENRSRRIHHVEAEVTFSKFPNDIRESLSVL
jgi:hypothetical protein